MKTILIIIATIISINMMTFTASFVEEYRQKQPNCGSGMVDENTKSYKNCMRNKTKIYLLEDLLNLKVLYIIGDIKDLCKN